MEKRLAKMRVAGRETGVQVLGSRRLQQSQPHGTPIPPDKGYQFTAAIKVDLSIYIVVWSDCGFGLYEKKYTPS